MLKVLIPTDYSENAWNAAQYAMCFFEHCEVCFYSLHIHTMWDPSEETQLHSAGVSMQVVAEPTGNVDAQDWEQQLSLLNDNPRHQFVFETRIASFVKGIRTFLQDFSIDFVVIGTKGAAGRKESVMGRKTAEIITKVKCSALIIPERARFALPAPIAFPSDFNLELTNSVINKLLTFAGFHHSAIKVLRVAQSKNPLNSFQKAQRALLKQALSGFSHSFHVVENTDLQDGLERFVNEMDVQIVAMIAKNLNLFQKLLFTPTVTRLTYSSSVPFLILHE